MFRSVFQKIWTAIVAGTTGAVLGLVATIIMAQLHIAPANTGLIAVWIFAGSGFLLGLIFGGRRKISPTT